MSALRCTKRCALQPMGPARGGFSYWGAGAEGGFPALRYRTNCNSTALPGGARGSCRCAHAHGTAGMPGDDWCVCRTRISAPHPPHTETMCPPRKQAFRTPSHRQAQKAATAAAGRGEKRPGRAEEEDVQQASASQPQTKKARGRPRTGGKGKALVRASPPSNMSPIRSPKRSRAAQAAIVMANRHQKRRRVSWDNAVADGPSSTAAPAAAAAISCPQQHINL